MPASSRNRASAALSTKASGSRWCRSPQSLGRGLFVAQVPDPGIDLFLAPECPQCSDVMPERIGFLALAADHGAPAFNQEFDPVSLVQTRPPPYFPRNGSGHP